MEMIFGSENRRRVILGLSAGALMASMPSLAQGQTAERWLDGGAGFDLGLSRSDVLSRRTRDEAIRISQATGHRALLIWHKGRILLEDYAEGDSTRTLMPGFSMAKSVLGLMFGLAIEKDVIASIDDPVGLYLSEWSDDVRGQTSLRQLLQMRSGLHLYSLARGEPEALAMVQGSQASSTALATPQSEPAGQTFRYANVNSQIAGLALARALQAKLGLSYGDALEAWLWKPLGLGRSRLELESHAGYPRFFAGLEARARDWLGLATVFLRSDMVSPDWLDEMAKPSAHAPYGMHIWRGAEWQPRRHYGDAAGPAVPVNEPYYVKDMLVWDGAGGQRAYISAEAELVIVRLGHPSWDWEDSALPNLILGQLGYSQPSVTRTD